MGSSVEVGAVISDLESEYERSKRFLEDLYKSLDTSRNPPAGSAVDARQAGYDGSCEKDAEAQDHKTTNPFASYALEREDSDLSTSSEYSSSVPNLPDLRADGRSPPSAASPVTRATIHRRDDGPSPAATTPKRKTSNISSKKPFAFLSSCPVVEIPAIDETTPQPASASGGAEAYLQRRTSNMYCSPNGFGSLDSVQLAQVLSPSVPPVPTGRRRRSSLDFIPAPSAHMRKWLDTAPSGGPQPSGASGSGSSGQEGLASRASHPVQPNKARSLEVMGNQAASPVANNAMPPTGTAAVVRPPAAGGPPTYRRSSVVMYGGVVQGLHPHSGHTDSNLQLPLPLESPTPPIALPAGATHIAWPATVVSGSPGSNTSLHLLPPLQHGGSITTGYLPPPQPTARAVHSSIEFSPGGPGADRGSSWSGVPLNSIPQSLSHQPELGEYSPRDRQRGGRFARCLASPTSVSSGSGGGGTGAAAVVMPSFAAHLLSPTPPSASRGSERRPLAGSDHLDRRVPRAASLLSMDVPKHEPAKNAGVRGMSFRTNGVTASQDGASSGGGSCRGVAAADGPVMRLVSQEFTEPGTASAAGGGGGSGSGGGGGGGGAAAVSPSGGGSHHFVVQLPASLTLGSRPDSRVRSMGGLLGN